MSEQLIADHLLKGQYPSIEDIHTIQRQLNHPISKVIAVTKQRCQYGYPQAFVQAPMSHRLSSGMVRLTCPHLVKEIDKLEYVEHGISNINDTLNDPIAGKQYKNDFLDINHAWMRLRNDAVSEEERKAVIKRRGGDNLLNSGIIGITLDKVDDVKCLHAHVGDHLIRADNSIGEWALSRLKEKSVDPSGCQDCWQQCDRKFVPNESSWWYTPQKNRQGLRMQRRRRNEMRSREAMKMNVQSDGGYEDKKSVE